MTAETRIAFARQGPGAQCGVARPVNRQQSSAVELHSTAETQVPICQSAWFHMSYSLVIVDKHLSRINCQCVLGATQIMCSCSVSPGLTRAACSKLRPCILQHCLPSKCSISSFCCFGRELLAHIFKSKCEVLAGPLGFEFCTDFRRVGACRHGRAQS